MEPKVLHRDRVSGVTVVTAIYSDGPHPECRTAVEEAVPMPVRAEPTPVGGDEAGAGAKQHLAYAARLEAEAPRVKYRLAVRALESAEKAAAAGGVGGALRRIFGGSDDSKSPANAAAALKAAQAAEWQAKIEVQAWHQELQKELRSAGIRQDTLDDVPKREWVMAGTALREPQGEFGRRALREGVEPLYNHFCAGNLPAGKRIVVALGPTEALALRQTLKHRGADGGAVVLSLGLGESTAQRTAELMETIQAVRKASGQQPGVVLALPKTREGAVLGRELATHLAGLKVPVEPLLPEGVSWIETLRRRERAKTGPQMQRGGRAPGGPRGGPGGGPGPSRGFSP